MSEDKSEAYRFRAPGRPFSETKSAQGLNELDKSASLEERFWPDVVAEVPVGNGISWALTKKKDSASLFHDAMVVQFGSPAKPSLSDLTEEEGTIGFSIAADIMKDLDKVGEMKFVTIQWNSTPYEKERPVPQRLKRVHIHTLGWTEGELTDPNFSSIVQNKAELTREERRAIKDPFLGVFNNIMASLVVNDEFLQQVPEFTEIFELGDDGNKGFSLRVKGGLAAVKSEKMFPVLQALERKMVEVHKRVSEIFIKEALPFDQEGNAIRPELLPLEQIRDNIDKFAKNYPKLKPRAIRHFQALLPYLKDYADVEDKNYWFIRGLGYTGMFYTANPGSGDWQLVFVPRVITGTGGTEALGVLLNRDPELSLTAQEFDRQQEWLKKSGEMITNSYPNSRRGPLIDGDERR